MSGGAARRRGARRARPGLPPAVAAMACAVLLAVVAALVVTLAAGPEVRAGGGEDAPKASAAPERSLPPTPPPAPEVGACHRLTLEQALAPTAPAEPTTTTGATPCRSATSLTFHVGRLDGAGTEVRRSCLRRLRTYLGGTVEQRRLSVLTTVWFTPGVEEQALGADWFRCDLVAPGPDGTLLRVTQRLRDSMGTKRAAKYELCASGTPGKKSFTHVPCARKHTWRAVATVDLPGKAHPGRTAVADQMQEPCTDAATEVAADPSDVRWSQEGPTKAQWMAGQRYGYCWVPSR